MTVAFSLLFVLPFSVADSPVMAVKPRAATPRIRHILKGHTDPVWSVVFSPDGKTLAPGSTDFTIRLWNPSNGSHRATLCQIQGVQAVAFSPNGKLLASADYNSLKLWDVEARKSKWLFRFFAFGTNSVAFSPNGKIIAVGAGPTLRLEQSIILWNTSSRKNTARWREHSKFVETVDFCPDGKLLITGSRDKTIKFWDAVNLKNLRTLSGHTEKLVVRSSRAAEIQRSRSTAPVSLVMMFYTDPQTQSERTSSRWQVHHYRSIR